MNQELRKLCNRIASERTRPAQQQTAAELRRDTQRALASGISIEGVQAWLEGLLSDAMAQQAGGPNAFAASKVVTPQVLSRAENTPLLK